MQESLEAAAPKKTGKKVTFPSKTRLCGQAASSSTLKKGPHRLRLNHMLLRQHTGG